MLRSDRDFSATIAEAVRNAERGTCAEIVVVVASRSGSYLDIALIGGAFFACIALAGALFLPQTFHPAWVMVEIPLVLGVAAWLVNRTPAVLGPLIPAPRARTQVERAAAAHFVSEAVHGVKGRTGLLVYVSKLEGRVALIADLGLAVSVHQPIWSTVRFGSGREAHAIKTTRDLVRGIAAIGDLLRERAPGVKKDETNEMPDAPRFVS